MDHEGEVLEVFATKRRDRRAALKFLKRTMKRYGPLGRSMSASVSAPVSMTIGDFTPARRIKRMA